MSFSSVCSRSLLVAIAFLFCTLAPIKCAFSQSCEERAYTKFNLTQASLTQAYNTAAAPIVWKYGQDLDICMNIALAETAALVAGEALALLACTGPQAAACSGPILYSFAIGAALIMAQLEYCNQSAWVEFYASHEPLYRKYWDDMAESWATLDEDMQACTNGGYGNP